MLGKITGQRLRLAKMHIANYCIFLESQTGCNINLSYTVKKINDDFKLVGPDEINSLIHDVNDYYHCFQNEQVTSINRGGYWKFRAMSALEAKNELARELNALKV